MKKIFYLILISTFSYNLALSSPEKTFHQEDVEISHENDASKIKKMTLSETIPLVIGLVLNLPYLLKGEPLATLMNKINYCKNYEHLAINGSNLLIILYYMCDIFSLSTVAKHFFVFTGVQTLIWAMLPHTFGFSVIWSGLLGVLLQKIREKKNSEKFYLPLIFSGTTLLYYFCSSPLATSVAHFTAIFLGYIYSSLLTEKDDSKYILTGKQLSLTGDEI